MFVARAKAPTRGIALSLGLVIVFATVAAAAAAPASLAPASPVEHRCGAGGRALCGKVPVPLDHAHPAMGTLHIGYERYPRTDRALPALEPIVAIEGGPGYPTTESRDYYLGLFRPIMDRHDLLLIDLRGTGTSGPIDCRLLQSLRPPQYASLWVKAVGICGRQLGRASDLYGTANAADDVADVLDALGISKVDLYGDSYGTFFSQTFAIRHPSRLRALVLDAAYPIEDWDPWWRDLARAARAGYRLACNRDPGCVAVGGDPVNRLARLDRLVAKHPISGIAPDADGVFRRVTVDPSALISIFDSGGYLFDPYRELDAAVRAALRPHPDDLPLLRLAREQIFTGSGGPLKYYSQGLADAVECTDYPQLYDMMAPPKTRVQQYARAMRRLRRTSPNAFAPFTIYQWVTSADEDLDSCLRWPVPQYPHPLLPPGHTYPNVPTLVLVGDLDSVTSAEGARRVAHSFPNSTFVEVSNMIHVSALEDTNGCAAGIVLRFVRTLHAGNTSCASWYPEIHVVDSFPLHASTLPGPIARRAALVAADTIGDVLARWETMSGSHGVGLRGGTFTATGDAHRRWTLHDVRWVSDVAVSGTVRLRAHGGALHAVVTLSGTGLPEAHLDLRWNTWASLARAHMKGVVGGRTVALVVPAG
jgi:pimeloyl-ACP methyl ester carboxylesterase